VDLALAFCPFFFTLLALVAVVALFGREDSTDAAGPAVEGRLQVLEDDMLEGDHPWPEEDVMTLCVACACLCIK